MDIAVSSSRIESFPNAIGEAMACGLPCAVTDAGDSRYMVGSAGTVVPPGDAHALAQGIGKMCLASAETRARLGRQARERVRRLFSLDVITGRYEQLYEELSRPCAA
jgi:glycosyltransferase involved in cell wall biosynthesis